MARSNPNTYLEGVRLGNERSYLGTMSALQQSSAGAMAPYVRGSFDDSDALESFKTGADAVGQGLSWLQSFGSARNNDLVGAVSKGFNDYGDAFSHDAKMESQENIYEATKKAMEAQQSQGLFSSILGAGVSIASAFCERRLKQDIAPIDLDQAWSSVRDLPLYSFTYRHDPLQLPAYGPMVDEVQQVDPSLLVPMDEQARLMQIADGQPIFGVDLAKRQAYESAALQAALQRIEQLEQRLAQLETIAC